MVTSSREEFLRLARAHHRKNPAQPIRVTRDFGWAPSLFSYDDGSHPTVVTANPVVYLSYVTWKTGDGGGAEPVLFREMYSGFIVVDEATNLGTIEVVLSDSLHDWLISHANEMQIGYEGQYVRVFASEPERDLQYAIDRPTSLTQKM
jgi:hypothetical protein